MKRLKLHGTIIFVLITVLSACKENKEEVQSTFNEFRFDNSVIQKLPQYDSLVAIIYRNHSILKSYSDQDGGTFGFQYMPLSTDPEVYKKLPPEVEGTIGTVYNAIGENYIAGFTLFPDSSIRIYVRRIDKPKSTINIDEHLSYFPLGKSSMRKREFPEKDTTLTDHWQYRVRVNDEGIF